ncbi:recombinase family protein [Haloarcula sp. S1CR25-12]|uniref:Recombinase family protein n=1 Tax=Haloarcula saliterrae TaxID=2950534 RepID=A0ABU2FI47_9EURY|nr:recombinase family protein [Haloarcula sp. S1CR25-12]MDS0261917.1 recombinase family protein [Haloarcula sp. S1CR25-12]
MPEIGIYARVSTTDQDPQRQLDELREFARDTYDEPEINAYADIIGGTENDRGEEYQRLRADIEDGSLDVVIVHELSRLSRLGAGEIHEFLEFCLSHETGVQDLEVGLEISLDDDLVDRAVSQLIAGVMGDLARVEHKQKLRRIQSGIDAAKEAGRWTGRPPAGFDVEDGYLQVNADEFLTIRRALERIEQGYTYAEAADGTPVAESTLRALHDDRRDLYFYAAAADERLQAAAQELEPLEKPDIPDDTRLPEQDIRTIVRDEIHRHQQ